MTDELFKKAEQYIPGGVNSPVRAFNGVGGVPLFISHAAGAYLYDTEDVRYLDYVGSWGPMVAGHAHPDVVQAVQDAAASGLSFGAPTELETRMAKTLCRLMPSLEKVRMVNSGTEAAMSAIRLARGFTGRDLLVKFEGCYHGHADSLLVKAGSGALTMGAPNSAGVPADIAQHTMALDYNNTNQVEEVFQKYSDQIAAVIVEPIAGNMSCVPAQAEFLKILRQYCDVHGALLIFDEVMTGFRVALGGAQSLYAITPDLTLLGKVIGGGLPVGAFGGRSEVMDHIAPTGSVYQAGTLSGNPVAMSAGLAMLELVSKPGFFQTLSEKTTQLVNGLAGAAQRAGVPFTTNHVNGMFGMFFSTAKTVDSFRQVMDCNTEHFKRFFHAMLRRQIYFAPSPFEAGFISAAHDDNAIQATISAAQEVFADW